jgi:hypothetical protein
LKFSLAAKSSLVVVLAIAALAFSLRGCQESAPPAAKKRQQDELRQFDRGEALLKAAAAQLSDLPASVDTDLRPPVVLLDSRKSADGKDVLAVCVGNPKGPADVFNVLNVPAGNGRFRSLGVRPGDIIKYYVKEDETVDDDSRKAGYSRQLAIDLIVAHLGGAGPGYPPQADSVMAVFADAAERKDPRMRNVYFDVATVVTAEATPADGELIAKRIRQVGVEKVLYGSDLSPPGGSVRAGWEIFRSHTALTDAEFRTIAANMLRFVR